MHTSIALALQKGLMLAQPGCLAYLLKQASSAELEILSIVPFLGLRETRSVREIQIKLPNKLCFFVTFSPPCSAFFSMLEVGLNCHYCLQPPSIFA